MPELPAGGLALFEGDGWRVVGSEWDFPSQRATWLLVDRDGALWVTSDRTLLRPRRGARRFEPTREPVTGPATIAQAQDGTLWLSDERLGTRTLQTSDKRRKDSTLHRSRTDLVHSKRLLFDRDGNLWGTDAVRGGPWAF